MTKREFLDTLRMQLEGELSPSQIEGHLHYYDEYISEATAAGRRESDVLDELGSPVFIAKTLLETGGSGNAHCNSEGFFLSVRTHHSFFCRGGLYFFLGSQMGNRGLCDSGTDCSIQTVLFRTLCYRCAGWNGAWHLYGMDIH